MHKVLAVITNGSDYTLNVLSTYTTHIKCSYVYFIIISRGRVCGQRTPLTDNNSAVFRVARGHFAYESKQFARPQYTPEPYAQPCWHFTHTHIHTQAASHESRAQLCACLCECTVCFTGIEWSVRGQPETNDPTALLNVPTQTNNTRLSAPVWCTLYRVHSNTHRHTTPLYILTYGPRRCSST